MITEAPKELAKILDNLGIKPFPHQVEMFKAIYTGSNAVLTAPTGSGKTEAVILPLLSMMVKEKVKPVSLLYVTPLRALINDLTKRLRKIFEPYGFTVARKHGDTPVKERRARIKKVPHVLITTPESLEIDLDLSLKLRRHLTNVKWVVIDELHEIARNKRGLQLAILLERLRRLAGDFQTIGLSATASNASEMFEPFTGTSQRGFIAIKATGKKYFIDVIKADDIISALRNVIRPKEKVLIFVNSRRLAEKINGRLESDLQEDIAVHHSSISGKMKESVEVKFKEGTIKVVVATKTLELGIDIGDIDKIIHIGAPTTVSSLVQRAGRASHNIWKPSKAVIVVEDDEGYYLSIAAKTLAERGIIEKFSNMPCYLDVVAREILGYLLRKEDDVEKVIDIITSVKPCFKEKANVRRVVKLLEKQGLLRISKDNKGRVGRFFYRLWSNSGAGVDIKRFFTNIPNTDEKFLIKMGEENIGFLDTNFVLKFVRPWDRIRVAGRVWEVESIDLMHKTVNVRPSLATGQIPLWRGSFLNHSTLISKEFFDCLNNCELCNLCNDEVYKWFTTNKVKPPSAGEVIVERINNNNEVIYGPQGHRFFELLGYVLFYSRQKNEKRLNNIRVSPLGIASKRLLPDLKALKAQNVSLEEVIKDAVKITPQYHLKLRELLPSFGSLKDPLVEEEAVKQVIEEFNLDTNALLILKKLIDGEIVIRVIATFKASPIARLILSSPILRPWYGGSYYVIAESLRGTALTPGEISEISGLSPSYVERKLKHMRRFKGRLKTIAFFDISDGQVRWALAEELSTLAKGMFRESFTPKVGGIYIVSLAIDRLDPGKSVIIHVKHNDLKKICRGIDANIVYKVTVKPINGSTRKLTYYNVPKELVPLVIRNAVAFLEGMGYASFN